MNDSIYPYAEGQEVKVLSGQVRLSPAVLANPAGQPDDILVVAGQVVVTVEVTAVGYRTVIIAGQLAAPAGPAADPMDREAEFRRLYEAHRAAVHAIFARVVASPFESAVTAVAPADPVPGPVPAPGLDPAWWRGFTAGFATRMVASTAPVRLAA